MLEYDALLSAEGEASQLRFPRPALLRAFEYLVTLGLVQIRGDRARAQLQHAPARLAVSGDELRAFVRGKADCPMAVQRWATSFVDAVVN